MATILKRAAAVASHPHLIVRFLIRRLRPTSVDETAQNDSLVLLKELLARDYPEIENEHIEDWGKVKLLRQWTHEHVNLGTASAQLDQEKSFGFYAKDAPAHFSAFLLHRGGVMCMGASYTLMKLYRAYGFDSYILGIGNRDVATHAVTLVKINYNGRNIFTIHDAIFDLAYTDLNSEPYDYLDFLRVIKNHNHHMVVIEHGAAGAPDFIVHPEDDLEPFYGLVIEPGDEPVAELSEGRLKYKSRETIEVFNSRFGPSVAEFLTKDGHPPDMIYLFLYLLYIQDEQLNAVDELVCQAEAVLR